MKCAVLISRVTFVLFPFLNVVNKCTCLKKVIIIIRLVASISLKMKLLSRV